MVLFPFACNWQISVSKSVILGFFQSFPSLGFSIGNRFTCDRKWWVAYQGRTHVHFDLSELCADSLLIRTSLTSICPESVLGLRWFHRVRCTTAGSKHTTFTDFLVLSSNSTILYYGTLIFLPISSAKLFLLSSYSANVSRHGLSKDTDVYHTQHCVVLALRLFMVT